MAKHRTLHGAMAANNLLAEAEIRYRLLAEVFEAVPNLRANLNPQLERAKAEIAGLRAAVPPKPKSEDGGKVVAFDATRFHKSGAQGGAPPSPPRNTNRRQR